MRSKASTISELKPSSSLLELDRGKKQPSTLLTKIHAAGIQNLEDLLWILPLRVLPVPQVSPFKNAREGQLFLGQGKIIHCEIKPAFGRRTKGKFLLHNGFIVVRELSGDATLSLRFFNLYPQQKKQLEMLQEIWFLGELAHWRAQLQMVNPKISPLADSAWDTSLGSWIKEYPTLNKVPGVFIAKLINSLPSTFWSHINSEFGTDSCHEMPLREAFKWLHAQHPPEATTPETKKRAIERLAYEEFFLDQLKIATRRKFIKQKSAPVIGLAPETLQQLLKGLPFKLTEDQGLALESILSDLKTGSPMMRMLQGDVGCGKTVVAMLVAQAVIRADQQVALMCPTEALAQQHFSTLQDYFGLDPSVKPALVLGSQGKKEKTQILKTIKNGGVNFIIGTHALFQESVVFHNLSLAIIDEQHKFGVEQRLKLTSKGPGTHCLIMSATPIPRTLSLAQYGDLDFTTIRSIPQGRKGIKTRVVAMENYPRYIDFLRQRLSLGEQGYMVFPAIEESEAMPLQNVTEAFERYRKELAGFPLAVLHGKMKSEEKEAIIKDFTQGKLQVLISTSVIEVGINVPNASFMCIYDPERFGLSSLHQLRGRVGRGEKVGFCFLVLDEKLSEGQLSRLQLLEQTTDGFAIAEADLENRGEGDLFGVDQSGDHTRKRVADYSRHARVLEKVYRDVQHLRQTEPDKFDSLLLKLAHDQKILDTI